MKKPIKILISSLLLMILLSSLSACRSSGNLQKVDGDAFVLGTFGQIRVFTSSEAKGKKAIDKAFKRITEIENTMSASLPNTDVAKINKSAGKSPVKVNPDTLFVINKGIEYEKVTKGTFNITLGSLIELWGIGKDWQKVPTLQEIQEAQKHIDINQLEVKDKKVLIKDPQMLMDLGGIAKGYAVDEAVKVLKESGIKSGFVNLGGDIYVFGDKPDQTPWYIGIQKPVIESSTVMARVNLYNQSIVSSGDYERYFEENDVRYHHIIDPATGYPSDGGIVSVTIISDKAIDGDVLSTSVFILGLEEGLELLEGLDGIEGVIITNDNSVYTTSGMANKVEILDESYKLIN